MDMVNSLAGSEKMFDDKDSGLEKVDGHMGVAVKYKHFCYSPESIHHRRSTKLRSMQNYLDCVCHQPPSLASPVLS